MISLRARLTAVVVILFAVYVVLAFVIVSTQRSVLIAQMDRRLAQAPAVVVAYQGGNLAGQQSPTGGVFPRPGGTPASLPPPVADTTEATDADDLPAYPESQFSDFYMGFVDHVYQVTPLVTGTILKSVPDLAGAVQARDGTSGFITVGSEGSTSNVEYRALVVPQKSGGGWVVVTQSLTEVDAAISRLVRTLVIAGCVLAVVLGAIVFWVQRLGLRPIARVTAAAEAIASGNRSYRLTGADVNPRTEAGKLARAFNLMLDERDESEVRFRQFVADASHELRTPLTSVRGYLELYQGGAFRDSDEVDDAVRRMASETTRMYGLVEDLLVLASLDEGRPLRREAVDIGQLLRDAAQDAGAVQPDRRIVTVAPDVGPTVVGDPSLLVQCVGILVSNALVHTPVGADLTLTATDGEVDINLTVSDSGPGIDPQTVEHIFDRFWRGRKARERTRGQGRGGAGLGLAIARSIVAAHGGAIVVHSTVGKGTVFNVTLPKHGRDVG